MALFKCPECGKEISSDAKNCPNCGYPIAQNQGQEVNVNAEMRRYHGPFSVLRLFIGIFSILCSFVILYEAFFAGLANALTLSGDMGGTAGVFVAILFIAAGITGIATRNSRNRGGAIACFIMFLLSALLGFSYSEVYRDLSLWGGIALVFSLVFLIAAIRTKKSTN